MSYKISAQSTPKIEQISDTCFVDWNRKKVIKNGLAKGTHYASYYDKDCKEFSFWLDRKHMKFIKADSTAITVNNTASG